MNYIAVIPSIHQPYTDACLKTCPGLIAMTVDNTKHNRGVCASWNLGVKKMYECYLDWIVLLSAAVRFGAPGGLDFIDHLADPVSFVVEAKGWGWHLIAFRKGVFDAVGNFDENFFPGPLGDNDFGRRITLWLKRAGYDRTFCRHCHTDDISGHHHEHCPDPEGGWKPTPLWRKVDVDYTVESVNHGVELGGAKDNPQAALDYYEQKWGGPRQRETFTHPYGDARNPLNFWKGLPYGGSGESLESDIGR